MGLASYPGSKATLAEWIIGFLRNPDECNVYVEPFCGSAAVLLASPRYRQEIISDKDKSMYSLFRVLQDEGKRREFDRKVSLTCYSQHMFDHALRLRKRQDVSAVDRAWSVAATMAMSYSHGGKHFAYTVGGKEVRLEHWRDGALDPLVERLRDVQCLNRDYRYVLDMVRDKAKDRNLRFMVYCDPPYPGDVSDDKVYAHNFTDDDQREFLAKAFALGVETNVWVAISSYANDMYDSLLNGWHREDKPRVSRMGGHQNKAERLERLYLSYKPGEDMLFNTQGIGW